jgi:hypothetical protein
VVRVHDAPAVVANFSYRARADRGTPMIGGFWIDGGRKRILLRGVGAGLTQFGVAGLADATLRLYRGAELLAHNDDWQTGDNAAAVRTTSQALQAFALDASDAALLVTLDPGGYTAHLEPVSTTGGVALLEIYAVDAASDTAAGSRLLNASGSARISAESPSIISVVVAGQGSRGLLVRAAAPALRAFGADYARDPKIEWARATGGYVYRGNDNWEDNELNLYDTRRATAQGGAFDFEAGGRDAALFVRVYPGMYSLIAYPAVEDDAGRVLSEIYDVGS